jgi:cysteine synthase A
VAIAPDLGERYLDTIYQRAWLEDLYGDQVLDDDPGPASEEVAAGGEPVAPACDHGREA